MDLFTQSGININSSFQRSTRIDNKISKEFLNHYIFHDTSRKVLDQIANSINNTIQSAFTLTGPYGTGKSSLALFLKALISKDNKTSNWLFLIGLILGPLLITSTSTSKIDFIVTDSVILISIAGFLVGLGTRIGGGCTSGHGICGISRFSIRSILGTLIFIITAVLTVFILQQYGFYL